MARRSRKGTARQVTTIPTECVWNTAVYARLSVEDSGRKGADTIDTQIELITSYVSDRSYLSLYDTYIDNGASGKDFDRPAWQRLMNDIRAGRVDCVCVKDLSRFGRNYIETCEFLEKIFPFMGVRFVSVNDGYDSNSPGNHNEGLIVALKSLVNDQYLRDVSRKICASVKARQERGEYTRGFAPFGYQKVDGQKGRLEPDPVIAPIIRDIFNWRLEGISHAKICKRLDEMGIPTPNEHLRRTLENPDMYGGDHFKSTTWRVQSLKHILVNPIYIGTIQTGKGNQRLYEHKPCTVVPREQWIVTENAHEPILDRELWEKVQAVQAATNEAYKESGKRPPRTENVLKGFVVCAVCGSKPSRLYSKKVYKSGDLFERYYFKCPIHHQHPAEQQPYRTIREDVLLDAVFPLVAEKLRSASNLAKIIEKRTARQGNPRAAIDAEISRTARELETINDRMAGLYENFADRLLTEHEYVRIKAGYERQTESLRERMDALSQRAAVISDVSESDNHWLAAARSFQNPTQLTRAMLEAIVDRIMVYNPETIEVEWKFKDEFALLEACAKEEVV